MATRRSGTEPVSNDAHKVEPKFTGDDIAMGITYQMALDEKRSIVIQTHTGQSVDAAVLNALLDKITKAADRTGAKYRLKECQLLKQQFTDQLAMVMENYSVTQKRYQDEWATAGRRGPFKPSGSQESAGRQSQGEQDRLRKQLGQLDTEIKKIQEQIAEG